MALTRYRRKRKKQYVTLFLIFFQRRQKRRERQHHTQWVKPSWLNGPSWDCLDFNFLSAMDWSTQGHHICMYMSLFHIQCTNYNKYTIQLIVKPTYNYITHCFPFCPNVALGVLIVSHIQIASHVMAALLVVWDLSVGNLRVWMSSS